MLKFVVAAALVIGSVAAQAQVIGDIRDERGGFGRGGRGDDRGGYDRGGRGGRDDRDGGYGRGGRDDRGDRGVRCTITTTNYNIYHGRGRTCADAQRDVIGECVAGQKARGVANWDRCLHSVRPGRKYVMSCTDGCGY